MREFTDKKLPDRIARIEDNKSEIKILSIDRGVMKLIFKFSRKCRLNTQEFISTIKLLNQMLNKFPSTKNMKPNHKTIKTY